MEKHADCMCVRRGGQMEKRGSGESRLVFAYLYLPQMDCCSGIPLSRATVISWVVGCLIVSRIAAE